VKLLPSRLEPRFVERIWGSQTLGKYFPHKTALEKQVGEVWMTGDECVFASGPFRGQKLGDAWPKMPEEWAGTKAQRGRVFPLLVKFLFPGEKPSVQVHPTDDYAEKNEAANGGVGKTEMWYVAAARPGASVLVNLRPGATRDKLERAIADSTIEEWLERVDLVEGDVVFVPAGTLHTIGPGLVLCEIQQNSHITYRVYDYKRRDPKEKQRALHVKEALEVINFGEQSGGKMEPVQVERGAVEQTYYVACQHFVTERWRFSQRVAGATSKEHFDLLITISGGGAIECRGEELPFEPGECWMLPAGLGAYRMSAEEPVTLLRTYVPGKLDEFARGLADQGVEEAEWSRLVYP
jgi:mannose-6-phosphate isomerase